MEQKGKNTGYGSTKRFSGEKLFREPASFPSLDPYFGSFGQLQNLESPSQPFLPTLGKSEEEISANVIEFLRAAKEGNKDLVESLILEIEVNATNPVWNSLLKKCFSILVLFQKMNEILKRRKESQHYIWPQKMDNWRLFSGFSNMAQIFFTKTMFIFSFVDYFFDFH